MYDDRDKIFAIVGGDLRQACLANLLARSARHVYALCMDECTELSKEVTRTNDIEGVLPQCGIVIFPLPLSSDGTMLNAPFSRRPPELSRCLVAIPPFAEVFGGKIDAKSANAAEKLGIAFWDYYRREELMVLNCIPTALAKCTLPVAERG